MDIQSCCTCASLLSTSSTPVYLDEKHPAPRRKAQRHLQCCGRLICEDCIKKNPRFETYCPFCQISTAPSILPESIREPPTYSPPASPVLQHADLEHADLPPPYSRSAPSRGDDDDDDDDARSCSSIANKRRDVVHFVDHARETMSSIALRYRVPVPALRRANNLYADHLLAARRTVLIPAEYYRAGVSLSPRPVEGEEEELRKAKIRRWMVACKVAEYDVALIYLKQANYDLERAVEAYRADEAWEKNHPLHSSSKTPHTAPTPSSASSTSSASASRTTSARR